MFLSNISSSFSNVNLAKMNTKDMQGECCAYEPNPSGELGLCTAHLECVLRVWRDDQGGELRLCIVY